jgi:hypothetical protein
MARDYGQIQHRIWADPEWRALDADAQLLYLLLLSQPSMNQAGVLPMQLRKWSRCVHGWTVGSVDEAIERLAAARFLVVDEDTEEVLVRSFIRNDGSYRIPGVLKSALKSATAVQSPAIRAALAVELGRLPALEGKTAVDGTTAIRATRAALNPGAEPIPEPIPEGIDDRCVSNPSRMGSTEPIPEPIAEPPLSVSGSVSGVPHVENLGGKSAPPPPRELDDEPPLCAKHHGQDRDTIPPCRACGRLRGNWELARDHAAKPAPKPAPKPGWCGHCDQTTRLLEVDDRTVTRCPTCHPHPLGATA